MGVSETLCQLNFTWAPWGKRKTGGEPFIGVATPENEWEKGITKRKDTRRTTTATKIPTPIPTERQDQCSLLSKFSWYSLDGSSETASADGLP